MSNGNGERARREREVTINALWTRAEILDRLVKASGREDVGSALEDAAVALFRAAQKIRDIETIVRLSAAKLRVKEPDPPG
jgi:hypothetical protein